MKRTLSIGMWVLLVLAFAGVCMYMNANIDSLLDSDISSELVLAKLLSQEKQIISPNWYYSTELRVLNTQLVFAPLFLLTDNWHTVRVLGSAILYLILLASAFYCCRQLGIKRTAQPSQAALSFCFSTFRISARFLLRTCWILLIWCICPTSTMSTALKASTNMKAPCSFKKLGACALRI